MELYHNKSDLFNKVQKTIVEMFHVRQYTNINEQPNIEDNTILPIVTANTFHNEQPIIAYISFNKLGKDKILKFIKQIETDNIQHSILITMEDLTSQAKKIISDNGTVELFLIRNVMYNILNHVLQPKFVVLHGSEVKQLLDSLQCSLVELPKISVNDPVSKFFNVKPRDVFKIYRKENIYYRVVV